MTTGRIITRFEGDPEGLMAAHARIKAAQKEMEEGYERVGRVGKQMGQDVDAALGMVDRKAIELRQHVSEAFLSMENSSSRFVANAKADIDKLDHTLGMFHLHQRRMNDEWDSVNSGFARQTKSDNLNSRYWGMVNEDFTSAIAAQGGVGKGTLADIDDAARKSTVRMKEAKEATRSLTDEMLGMASAYFGAYEAINFVNTALERQKQLKLESQAAVGDVATMQAKVAINLDQGDAEVYSRRMSQLGRKYGIMPTVMGDIAQSALSATGGNADRAARISEKAIQLGIHTPQDINEFSAGVGGLMDAVPGITLDQATELVVSAGRASKIEQQGNVGEYIGKSVTGQVLNANLTKRQAIAVADDAAAITSTFSRLLNDKEGRISAEAAVRLSADARDFFAENLPGVDDPGDTLPRIDWLVANRPDLIPAFKKSLRGESSQKAAAESFIDRKENTMKILEEARKTTGIAGGEAGKLIGYLDHGTPEIIAKRLANKAEAGKAYDAAEDVRGSLLASAETQFERARTQYEREYGVVGSMGTSMDRIGSKWMSQPFRSDKGFLESQIQQLEFGKSNYSAKGKAEIDDVIAELKKIVTALDENKEAMKAYTDRLFEKTLGAASGMLGLGLTEDQIRRARKP